ncbi:MAG: TM0106 family RecB-like putative nuclease [Synechococcus sp.]|nr:TM0106 family RecB-like putative nuclease [Synechococcus sp.]
MTAARSITVGAATPTRAPLTDRLLRSWLRCRRRAWLDRHGPLHRRQWNAHRALALEEQLRWFQQLLPQRPGHGEEACRRGDAGVIGLRLCGDLALPGPAAALPLQAHPPLLQRVEGHSRWGGYAYRPVLARQGRRLTREHRLQLALWGNLLAAHQQGPVPQGLALGRGERGLEREPLPLGAPLQRQLQDALQRLAGDLQRPQPPALVNDRRKCVLCGWRSLCDAEATAEGHLSEVSGIGGKRRDLLLDQGITSLSELAAADPQQLAAALAVHGEQHREVAAQLVAQARVQASGLPHRRGADGTAAAVGAAVPGPLLPELQTAAGVLIYDIESDPDVRDDFLHGILRIDRDAGGHWPLPAPLLSQAGQPPAAEYPDPAGAAEAAAASGFPAHPLVQWNGLDHPAADAGAAQAGILLADAPYHPFLALQEHGERRLWRRLQALLHRYPDRPLLHYGETEAISLLRLAERMGAGEAERQRLRRRLLDVHQRLRQHWLLPVNSYGLKAVAAWQGFRWSQSGVDGARCLLWWRQWRRDRGAQLPAGRSTQRRGRQQLQRIFRYNRDDCLATWWVTCWLLERDRGEGAASERRD